MGALYMRIPTAAGMMQVGLALLFLPVVVMGRRNEDALADLFGADDESQHFGTVGSHHAMEELGPQLPGNPGRKSPGNNKASSAYKREQQSEYQPTDEEFNKDFTENIGGIARMVMDTINDKIEEEDACGKSKGKDMKWSKATLEKYLIFRVEAVNGSPSKKSKKKQEPMPDEDKVHEEWEQWKKNDSDCMIYAEIGAMIQKQLSLKKK